MGIFAFSSLSACAWIGVGEAGTSNPGFPGPEGSIRFIAGVPSCVSSPSANAFQSFSASFAALAMSSRR